MHEAPYIYTLNVALKILVHTKNIMSVIPRKWRCWHGRQNKMTWTYGFIATTAEIYLRLKIERNRKTKDKKVLCYMDKFVGICFVLQSIVKVV